MKTIKVLLVIICIILIGIFFWLLQKPEENVGSVAVTNEYNSTTTQNTGFDRVVTVRTGYGTLGNVTITNAGTGFFLYDATTTNVNLRAAMPTSSLPVLAAFGPSAAVGNYTFDSIFYKGLLYVANAGTIGSSTITYR